MTGAEVVVVYITESNFWHPKNHSKYQFNTIGNYVQNSGKYNVVCLNTIVLINKLLKINYNNKDTKLNKLISSFKHISDLKIQNSSVIWKDSKISSCCVWCSYSFLRLCGYYISSSLWGCGSWFSIFFIYYFNLFFSLHSSYANMAKRGFSRQFHLSCLSFFFFTKL